MATLPTILRADLDSFYASVEQVVNPTLLGRAMAVGGGVVLAASYEAKAFGVYGGMSGRRARQLCPSLIFVDGQFSEYQRLADEVMVILGDFTPFVQRVSIDEAFLDVAGTVHLFGPPAARYVMLRPWRALAVVVAALIGRPAARRSTRGTHAPGRHDDLDVVHLRVSCQ